MRRHAGCHFVPSNGATSDCKMRLTQDCFLFLKWWIEKGTIKLLSGDTRSEDWVPVISIPRWWFSLFSSPVSLLMYGQCKEKLDFYHSLAACPNFIIICHVNIKYQFLLFSLERSWFNHFVILWLKNKHTENTSISIGKAKYSRMMRGDSWSPGGGGGGGGTPPTMCCPIYRVCVFDLDS